MKKWLKTIITVIIIIGIIAASFVPIFIQWDSDIYAELNTEYKKCCKLVERRNSAYMTDEEKEVYIHGE